MFNKAKKKFLNIPRKVAVIAIAIIVIGGIVIGIATIKDKQKIGQEKSSDYYQAVFLENGQVYFGKVENKNNQFVNLTDVYYLQVSRNLQSPTENKEQSQNLSDLNLIKLGNELHGPQDEMQINRDYILFIENLKNESRVVQVIKNYKK